MAKTRPPQPPDDEIQAILDHLRAKRPRRAAPPPAPPPPTPAPPPRPASPSCRRTMGKVINLADYVPKHRADEFFPAKHHVLLFGKR